MNIYHISQDEHRGYETYDSAVVVAENEHVAQRMHPDTDGFVDDNEARWPAGWNWCNSPTNVKVTLIGTGEGPRRFVCKSFNAG